AQPVSTITDPQTPSVNSPTFAYDSGTGGNLGLVEHDNPQGNPIFWSGRDGVEFLKDRPIEPRVTNEATTTGGLRAHGVRITELTTHDVPVTPEIATPIIDLSSHEPADKVTNVIFPATLASINHWSAFGATHDQLVV